MADLTTMFNENENNYGPLSLQGDVSRYPFDEYNLDLLYIIPVKKVAFRDNLQNLFQYDLTVKSSWEPYPIATYSDITDQTLKNLDFYCKASPYYPNVLYPTNFIDPFPHDQFTVPIPICSINGVSGYEDLKEEDKKTMLDELRNENSVLHFELIFQRNYTIYGIIIPILAIFFLLGAIFVFDFQDVVDLIGSRLALTLGIFALIFTLPEIINSMKPLTSSPTIADSMLSIIIIATIAFTVSSVLSSSSVIRNWFPKHHTWIDGIVFLIVSGIVVSYFSNYPSDITLWLVPLILFGLGYGLLLRLLGIKITKPLKNIFEKRSNNRIVKRSPL